jgi:hypothetical protein
MPIEQYLNKKLFNNEDEYDVIQHRIIDMLHNNIQMQIPQIVNQYISQYSDSRHKSILISKINDTLKYMMDKGFITINNALWITLKESVNA